MLLCAAALGIVLGLCFRIIVMLPAMLVAAAGIAVLGVSSGQNIRIAALNLVVAGISLQIGYFIGAILAEYQRRQTELRRMAAWAGERPVIDEVIYRSEPDSGGERDQWVWSPIRRAASAACGMTASHWKPADQALRLSVRDLSCLWRIFWGQSNHRT
jgi:hypothetical protein